MTALRLLDRDDANVPDRRNRTQFDQPTGRTRKAFDWLGIGFTEVEIEGPDLSKRSLTGRYPQRKYWRRA